jgi:ribosome biogenesis protein MAK21
MLKQGTLSDKVSALSAIVQKSPREGLGYLGTLVGMGKKKNRKMAEVAINALKELFCDVLLSDDKKLTAFSKNPIIQNSKNPSQQDLLQAYYEHHLKEHYEEFV